MKKTQIVLFVYGIFMITACKETPDTVKLLPEASFTLSAETAEMGDTIYFYHSCKNASTFEWDFGDDITSSEENPYHIYSEEGEYTIYLEVSNKDGSDQTSNSITIIPSNPCWSKLADLLSRRNVHMSAVIDNKIYVGGGMGGGMYIDEYDISNNTWKEKALFPIQGEWLSGCAFNGKVYAMGGWLNNVTKNNVEEYDPSTDTWTSKSPMLTHRWGHVAVPVGGKIYVIGGGLDWPAKFYRTIEVYDPSTDSWTTLPEQTGSGFTPRFGVSASVVNEKIYIMGGTQANNYPPTGQFYFSLDLVEVYDPESNAWEKRASMQTARWGFATATVNNKIYAMGGASEYQAKELLKDVEEYDPLSDTWIKKTPMSVGRIITEACAVNNIIYIPGGGGLTQYIIHKDLFVYDPACDTVSN